MEPLAATPLPQIPGDTLPRVHTDTLDVIPLSAVTVTVLRTPMQLERVPFAVSVLGDELGRTGRSGAFLEEALHGLPGVQVNNRFNDAVGERIAIRGFGARSQFGVRGIRILVDGIPATLPDGQSSLDHLDLGSLGQVEALRGPGSALYGNASGGVLLFRSRTPPDTPIQPEVRWMQGDHGLRRIQVTTTGTVSDSGYLLTMARYRFDGFRAIQGSPELGVYGGARRDHLNLQVASPIRGGTLRVTANAVDLDSENPGSLDLSTLGEGDRRAFQGNINQQTGKTVRQAQLGVGWDGEVGGRTVEVMGYGVTREVSNPIPSAIVDLDRRALGARATLRSGGGWERDGIWWAVGVEGDLQLDERTNHTNAQGSRGTMTLDQRERVLGGAIFLQALLPIAPRLDAVTGLRYDRIQFHAADRMVGVDGRPDGSGSRTLDSASPSFGFHFSGARWLGAYANLSTAFETPTTTELANRRDGVGGFNPELDPQVGVTVEVGTRGLVGRSIGYELTYYHTSLNGELIAFEVEEQPGRSYFRNAGTSRRDGVEVSLQWTPSTLWSARFSGSTNDARFRSFEVDGVDHGGNRVPGVTPLRMEALTRLTPGPWFIELRGERTGEVYANDANSLEALAPAYTLLDLRLGGNDLSLGGFRFSPFFGITNLRDKNYSSSVVVNAFGGRYFEPGPGRSLYMGATLAFGR